MNICPVCQTKVNEQFDYCLKCAWEFEYYFDELKDNEKKRYYHRLSIQKKLYSENLEIKKLNKKLLEENKFLEKNLIKKQTHINKETKTEKIEREKKQGIFSSWLTSSKNIANNIIVIDGLMYQNQPFNILYTWKEAKVYAKNLRLGGFDDWRVPTKKELIKIKSKKYHSGRNGKYFIREEFIENIYGFAYFWTSSGFKTSGNWGVRFESLDNKKYESNKRYLLCVRDK